MISVPPSKPGSNWLDRLRSSRGFPTGVEPDLERSLSTAPSSCNAGSSTRSESTQFAGRVDSVGRVRSVGGGGFSGMFTMGECSRKVSKKNSRKQSNPKFFNFAELGEKSKGLCSSSEDFSLNDQKFNRNKSNCSGNEKVANAELKKIEEKIEEEDEDEDEEVIDMKGYTRSEVTVIDTSLKEWKMDKWVFRKKDEWKIKDKKKSKFNAKKRKSLANNDNVDDDNDDNDGDEGKKNGVKSGELDVEIVNKKKKKKILHLNKARNDKASELLKEAAEFIGKVPQTRCPCPRPPDKLRIIKSSPVIPVKSIPSNDNVNPDTLKTDKSPVILLKSVPSINNVNGITRLGKSAKKGRPKKFMFI